jgi:hypothetical protein
VASVPPTAQPHRSARQHMIVGTADLLAGTVYSLADGAALTRLICAYADQCGLRHQWRIPGDGQPGMILLVSMNEQSSDEAEHPFGGLEAAQF